MGRKIILSLGFILATIAASVVFLWPSIRYYGAADKQLLVKEEPGIVKNIVNLGLDLQGGMRLVLEVDRSQLEKDEQKDVLDRAFTVIENRINALGVSEPTIQKQGRDRLIVELPGLKDEAMAKGVIGRTAQLQFNLQRETAQLERAVRVIDKTLKGQVVEEEDTALTDTTAMEQEEAQTLAERLIGGADAAKDTTVKDTAVEDEDSAAALTDDEELLRDVASFRELLVAVGSQIGASMQNVARVNAALRRKDVVTALENAGMGGNMFLWGHDSTMIRGMPHRKLYYLKRRAELSGDVIKDAWQELDQSGMGGGYSVELELNRRGARRFSSVTGANIGKNLAIVLDSTVYSAPQIRTKIPLGRAQITGSFTMNEAQQLAVVLRAGALPAPLQIVEERTIGPSLGQDSIDKGIRAGAVGLLLVVVFMLIYYKLSGLVATFALLLNILFVLAVMAGINATLTLPGIAGLVLIVGMSVDANVIVFERIREELALGKTVRSAIAAGYSRAFLTIMDANITTLITAGVLYWIGTGPIKGFAITLIFGIIASLFTALFVTRVIFDIATTNTRVAKLSI